MTASRGGVPAAAISMACSKRGPEPLTSIAFRLVRPAPLKGVGMTRIAAADRVSSSPREPACFGDPFAPSEARGVGHSRALCWRQVHGLIPAARALISTPGGASWQRHTSVRLTCCRGWWARRSLTHRPPATTASTVCGVGSISCRARWSRPGLTCAPGVGEALLPYGLAVGVGNINSIAAGRLLGMGVSG
ncbi:hypothetical protein [Fodinicola feengrottensis]|uniref:hypothetical protein n=1 Tax=Fodinicola feengrottensis TaxID=435914 RepID=UPI0036F44C69